MKPIILHVIQALSLGGAGRALIATAKASARLAGDRYRHRVVSLLRPAPEAVQLAEASGLEVCARPDPAALRQELAAADIVQLHWWNNPENQQLLRADWPATRLMIWYHVAGDHPPQLITPGLVDFADLNVPTNPWTFRELPVFRDLDATERQQRVAMVIDAADLDRVAGAKPRSHLYFNVGYIGTVDFVKMHRNYVAMNAAVRVPNARFIVCGHGIEAELAAQARLLGAVDRFQFRGYVQDIRPVIETLDVYGYPLCADAYASGELNLQEVMSAGVPPVVFPAGGIKGLVTHEKTGLVVHTETEYTQAIEYLYHHPAERRQLGLAAREYASAHFGAENAARDLNPLYEQLLRQPKQTRRWGVPRRQSVLAAPVALLDVTDLPACAAGSRLFVESLETAGSDFEISLTSSDATQLLAAEARISESSDLVRSVGAGGFRHFRRQYPDDPYLQLWHALALAREGRPAEAADEFGKAIGLGCTHWRVGWYIAQAARQAGNEALAREAAEAVLARAPEFAPARLFLGDGDPLQKVSPGAGVPAPKNLPDVVATSPVRPAATEVNEAFLASQREFWNVDTLDEAMYARVFTSDQIGRMSPEERRQAWDKSAVASREQILATVPHQPDWRVLEIGCGVGRVVKPMREKFARVDGVDISEKMIAYAREYLRPAPGSGEVLVNNGADLAALPDAAYDLVYSVIVFQHIRSVSVVRSYLREIRRVLKPGGFFRIQVHEEGGRQGRYNEEAQAGVQYGFSGNGYAPQHLKALLEEAGLEVTQLETIRRWVWATAQKPDSSPQAPVKTSLRSSAPAPASARSRGDVGAAPLLSAIVSTYNSERFMRGCLEDLERQTIADRMEILVIDSGSQQNERAIVEEFQQRYDNIRYIRTEREPLYAAWNRAIGLARGKYLTSANTDDRHEPHGLERHVEVLEKNPDAVLAYADIAFCENVHPDFGPAQLRGHFRWPDFDGPLLFASCYVGPQPVWRRDVHARHGLFDATYKSAGDYEFWLRLARSERFVHIPEVLGLYWYSPRSVGHDNSDLTRDESDRARSAHWDGPWATWPQLNGGLLEPIGGRKSARNRQATRAEGSQRLTSAAPNAPARSPFEIDFDALPGSPAPTPPLTPATASPTPTPATSSSGANLPSTAPADSLDAAEAHAREALQLNPGGIEARRLLVAIGLQRGRWQETGRLCLEILKLAPADVPTLLSLAKCFFKSGDRDTTRTVLERVLEIDPANALAQENLSALGAPAPTATATATKAERDAADAALAQCVQRAQAAIAEGKLTEARAALEFAVTLCVSDADLFAALGHVQSELGDVTAARKSYSLALAVDSNHPGASNALIELAVGREESAGSNAAAAPTAPAGRADSVSRSALTPTLSPGERGNVSGRAEVRSRDETSGAVASSGLSTASTGPNATAFAQLHSAFNLLQERRYADAQSECARYQASIQRDALPRDDRRRTDGPTAEISVVIVAYQTGRGLVACLDSLAASPVPPHEIIVVDNGGNEDVAAELARRPLLHVRMPVNVNPAEGRNIGVHFARAPIVAFVDDDALVEPGYLNGVLAAFRNFDIDGCRGKVRPKSDHEHNAIARHYDLGDLAFPAHTDTEGNSAFVTAVYREAGGMDPLLFGMEGVELSYRIARQRGDYRTIYWPGAVIHHDYASVDGKLDRKNSRHRLMRDYAVFKHPDLLRHHGNVMAFNRSDSARRTGHGLIRRRLANANAGGAGVNDATGRATAASQRPFFSICIPTYNRARFIRETIESALKQTYSRFEIVIVDDGSTDDTAEIVGQHRAENLRYIRKEHSGGPATRNRCIAEARGEFLVWVDSDDVILPRTLEIYASALERHPEVDVLYGDLRIINEQSEGDAIWIYRDYLGWPGALLGDLFFENRIPNVCTLVRKNAYERVGGYADGFPRAHDYEFWTRLAAVGCVHRVNEVVGLYRQHGNSLSEHKGKTDTSYEARAVQGLIEKHGLRRLLPACFHPDVPEERSMAWAWLLAAVVMFKYGQMSAGADYLKRSLQADVTPDAATIDRLYRAAMGVRGGSSQRNRRSNAPAARGEPAFVALTEQAVAAYRSGDAGQCARACAALTEKQPEAVETLLLVALSLARWGEPRMGRTAFGCLASRLSQSAYLDAAESADATPASSSNASESGKLRRSIAPQPAGKKQSSARADLARTLSEAAARVLDVSSVPVAAIETALQFIDAISASADATQFVRLNRHGLTPVCEVILGLNDGELRDAGGEALLRKVQQARAGLVPPAPASRPRPAGWSFCIITNGQRPAKLRRQIESIRALGIPNVEILVGGDVPRGFDDVGMVPMKALAARGRLAEMRNTLAANARYECLVVSDDDMIFRGDFFAGLQRVGDDFEVMSIRMQNPDGSRFWDWASVGGPRGQVLLDYWEIDPDTYVTGGLCVLKASVLTAVKWDENRGFYEAEDVDFSRRLQAAGVSIRFNPFCCVTHDDDRYTRVGRKVMRFDHILMAVTQLHTAGEPDKAAVHLDAAWRVAGRDSQRRAEVRATAAGVGLEITWAPEPTERSSSSMAAVQVRWEGTFLDLGSLSHVNRELTSALKRQPGVGVSAEAAPVDPASIQHQPSLQDFARQLREQPAASGAPHVTVRHAWPPDWRRPRAGAWVLIQPWEFGALPEDWVRELARVDEVWVPSRYVRQVYVDSGVSAEKVHVVPNGFDPARFNPAASPFMLATRKKFKFLFVGGTIHRKGPDLLLQAFLDRFTAQDDVCLVIKDFGGQSVYAGQTFEQQIAAARSRPNAPEILHLTDELTAEQMAGLYTACDCLVHPYRGEGFGLPVLEAMACGRPVIVTAGGATDDFVTDECGWKIPAVRRQFGGTVGGMKLSKPGWFLEVDVPALAERMAWVTTHPDEARTRGAAAARWAKSQWTWDHAADIARVRAQAIAARTASEAKTPAPRTDRTQAKPIELPACARIGHLGEARNLLGRKQLEPAWNATWEALRQRPFHPEAWLTLAEIAEAAGDLKQAKALADRARTMAPKWKPASRFLKGLGKSKTSQRASNSPTLAWPEGIPSGGAGPGRLSVCLIVRNEEQFLDRCLESVRGLATQIVVVDTGSTDGTVAIARRHQAEVYEFAWCDDFSAARNAALEHVTGDWVLFLDADEELEAADRGKLTQLMAKPAVLAYRLPMIDEGREAEGVNYVPRLYRNAPGLFYVGRVHEQVFSSVEVRRAEWGLENELGDATLRHHGYAKELVASRDKIARNLRLLEMAIEELPDEPNLLMNLGLELVRAGREAEGLERYQEAFEAMAKLPKDQISPELREALLAQFGTHLLKAKHYAEVARLYQSPLAKAHGLTASMHWVLGLACIESKLYSEGADQMRQCLAKRARPTLTLVNRNILKGGPQHCLALCLAAMKRNNEAAQAFQAALQEDPTARSVRFDYARFLASTGQEVEALKWVHQLMAEDPADVRVWRLGGEVALQKPDFIEFALDWTGEAVKTQSRHGALLEQRATALLLADHAADALPIWQRLTDNSPSPASAANWAARAVCETAAGRTSVAPPAGVSSAAIDSEFLAWYRRLLKWNASTTVGEINRRIEHWRAFAPKTAQMLESALAEADASA